VASHQLVEDSFLIFILWKYLVEIAKLPHLRFLVDEVYRFLDLVDEAELELA